MVANCHLENIKKHDISKIYRIVMMLMTLGDP